MPMKIYLVIGSRGEYSDHQEWPIKAFKEKDKAQQFVDAFPGLLKNVTDYYEETSEWYKTQCIANGVWNRPTNPDWSKVRGAIWDEKRRMEEEVEDKYISEYMDMNDDRSVPSGVSITEVELV